MSFILDALKKLEQEKAARKGGDINISDEIVRGSRRGTRKARRSVSLSVVLVALGLTFLLGASGAFLWYKHDAGNRSKGLVTSSGRKIPAAVEDAEDSQRTVSAEPAAPPVREKEAVAIEPASLPMVTKSQPRKEMIEEKSASRQEDEDQPAQSSKVVSGSGGSGLKVSGIAWQDVPSARRAVINGELVQEGAQVGGATVEEIMHSRVLFSSGGRRFTLSISGPVVVK